MSVSGVTTFSSSGELNLQGVNINSGTRGDVLAYDSSGKISKIALGSSGQVLKSDGNDLVFGALAVLRTFITSQKMVLMHLDVVHQSMLLGHLLSMLVLITSNTNKTSPAVIFVKAVHTKKHNFQLLFLNIQQLLVITSVLPQSNLPLVWTLVDLLE